MTVAVFETVATDFLVVVAVEPVAVSSVVRTVDLGTVAVGAVAV